MQERFCVCGFMIWVQYRFSTGGCETVFWSKNDEIRKRLQRCPCCCQKLDINELS